MIKLSLNVFFSFLNIINPVSCSVLPFSRKGMRLKTALYHCVIIIKNVPCQKCSQCGEEFINGSTMQKIESIISKLKSMLPEITVIDFQNAA